MRSMTLAAAVGVAAILLSSTLAADALKHEWYGTWAMNHDGHVGTLSIEDSKVDCATTAWCDMRIRYTDNANHQYNGQIAAIDDKLQHMTFYIDFNGTKQRFDGYIFSWDKTKIAGTTVWGNRTFGFFAAKR